MGEPDNVSGVLARAAARAARLAELDTAQTSIQKLLNIDMPPEMLPWGAMIEFQCGSLNTMGMYVLIYKQIELEPELFQDHIFYVSRMVAQIPLLLPACC